MTDDELKEQIAALLESQKKTDEQMRETDRRLNELREETRETGRSLKELKEQIAAVSEQQKKTDEQLRKTDEQLRKTDARLDRVAEKLNRLAEMYGGVSYNQGKSAEEFFYNSLKHNPEINGERIEFVRKNVLASDTGVDEEYDILLVNESSVYVVEVKFSVHRNDIDRFLEKKFPNFRKLFPEYTGRKIYPVIAGFSIDDDLKKYAIDRGCIVLQRRGKIIETLAA